MKTEQKKELKREKDFKLVLILGILVLSFLICFSLILFSIKILIEGELSYQKILLEQKEKEAFYFYDLEKEVKEVNLTINKINFFYQKKTDFIDLSRAIFDSLPPEVYLSIFNFSKPAIPEEAKYSGSIFLTGFAPSRQALTLLKKNLESEKKFMEVYFPSENWVKPNDIIFTVSFKLK